MPKLFADRNDPAWPMAFTFVTINLIAFIYIAIVYVVIVTKSKATLQGGDDHMSNRDMLSESKSTRYACHYFIPNKIFRDTPLKQK